MFAAILTNDDKHTGCFTCSALYREFDWTLGNAFNFHFEVERKFEIWIVSSNERSSEFEIHINLFSLKSIKIKLIKLSLSKLIIAHHGSSFIDWCEDLADNDNGVG